MKFLEIFIEKPRVLLLTLSFIILAGVSSVLSLPIQENPELAQRWGSVTTTYPGATPERIETQVVDQLERKLREVTDIDELDSIISQGFATTVVEFSQELDPELIEQTWSQVQDKMSLVEPFLPEGATISLVRSSGPPITNLYAIKWQGKDEPRFVMMSRIAEQLQTRLNSLDLTEKLRVFGAADEELSIKVDPSKLSSLGLTFADIASAISSIDAKKPIGLLSNANSSYLFKLKDSLIDISSFNEIPIKKENNQLIRLEDIAEINIQPVSPVEEIILHNGQRIVMVGISATMSQRVFEYVAQADSIVEELNESLPDEIVIEKIYDESVFVSEMFSNLSTSFFLATFFVLAFSFFFLGIRPGIIVTAILPFTVGLVLFGCNLIGLPLHQTSITGIIIALGLLIDNGIIVVEDYKYRRSKGLLPAESIKESVNHLFAPLAAATSTTVFAFMPIVTGEGSSIEFVSGMGITVIFSIISSLFLALVFVPVLMTYMEKIPFFKNIEISSEGYKNEFLLQKYRKFLFWAYKAPRRAISIALAFPLLGFISFAFIPKDFFPPEDRNMFQVRIELPKNASAEATLNKTLEVRQQIIDSELIDIDDEIWWIGSRLPRILMNVIGGDTKNANNNMAEGVYFAKDFNNMIDGLPQLNTLIAERNPDVRILVDNFFAGPPVFADIEYKIIGDDREVLGILGEELELIISNAPNIVLTGTDFSGYSTNIEFNIDTSNLYYSGLNPAIISNELFSMSNGVIVGTMLDGTKEIPIRLKGSNGLNGVIDQATLLTLPSENGLNYIENFGDSEITRKSGTITRLQSRKLNTVQGWVQTLTLPSETEAYLEDKVAEFQSRLPAGYTLKQDGQADSRSQSQGQVYSSAVLFIILIIAGLVFALNSFKQMLLIFSCGMLCVGLSYLGLFIGNQNYGFIGLIGVVGLIGLSINDSIIVLSHIKEEANKRDITKAEVIEIVIRSTRHIITTSATTIGGFAPLLFGSIFFHPLAWGMIIGVLGATLLALLYVPAVYMNMIGIKD